MQLKKKKKKSAPVLDLKFPKTLLSLNLFIKYLKSFVDDESGFLFIVQSGSGQLTLIRNYNEKDCREILNDTPCTGLLYFGD